MHLVMPILALQAPTATPTPTLFQQLVFDGYPGLLITTIYSVILCATVYAGLVSVIAMYCIWGERKVAGHMQCRPGPNRVGWFGLLQSLADGIKLLLKEDLAPEAADHFLFRMAPYLAFAPGVRGIFGAALWAGCDV